MIPIGFPSYMAIRSRVGARNYLVAGILVMSLFAIGALFVAARVGQATMPRFGF